MGWLRARFTVLDTPPMQVYASEKRSQPSQNECANHVGNAHNLRCHINKEIGQPAPHACRCSIAPRFMSRHRAMSSIPIRMDKARLASDRGRYKGTKTQAELRVRLNEAISEVH